MYSIGAQEGCVLKALEEEELVQRQAASQLVEMLLYAVCCMYCICWGYKAGKLALYPLELLLYCVHCICCVYGSSLPAHLL